MGSNDTFDRYMLDANERGAKASREISMMENQDQGGRHDVFITIHGDEKNARDQNLRLSVDSLHRLSQDSAFSDISRISRSSNKPPRIPKTDNLSRRKSLARSIFSKPKSRFGEQSIPVDSKILEDERLMEEEGTLSNQCSPRLKGSMNDNAAATLSNRIGGSPKTPMVSLSRDLAGTDEDEEIYEKVSSRRELKYRKLKAKGFIEWFLFLCILGLLIISLTVEKFQDWSFWGLKSWKWFLLVLVTFSGLMITRKIMDFVVLLIELNYLLKKKVLYFVYGLKKSVQVSIWLGLILITWIMLFRDVVEKSPLDSRILDFITRSIASLLIGAFCWMLKTLLIKILASSFHVNTFFDRIQESIFHQYILLTLSGPPLIMDCNMLGRTNSNVSKFSARVSKKGKKEGKKQNAKEVIDVNKLHKMKQDKISASTMKMLVDVISNSGLATLSRTIDESVYGGNEQTDKEITNEEEAIAAAYHIFRNVAQPGCKYIDEMDLRRFMIREEVEMVFLMIEVADNGQIDKKTLTDWVVKVYKGRKALAHALNDTKTAVKQLNKLVTGILIVCMVIVWLLLTRIASTSVLVLMSSQLVLAAFIFGNTCKTVFEAIIFVFVMHPFDVGDRCVVDGVQMIVEEMNILTTIFLRFDNEKIYYPNSVLATKPISNWYRSPDMGDAFEFSIDFKTPLEKIGALKDKINKYFERNPQHWYPNHNLVVKEVQNLNRIQMALYFSHTINFQDIGEKNRRKTGLVLEMKKILQELDIRYDLLTQGVRILNSID